MIFILNFISSKLETMLAVYPPCELLYDAKRLPVEMVRSVAEKHAYAANGTSASAGGKFPDAKKTLKLIQDGDYFADNQMPGEVDSATLWLLNSK